jgi:hypothetical protein
MLSESLVSLKSFYLLRNTDQLTPLSPCHLRCCRDHVVSHDLAHWKRLPSPARPGKEWYDSRGSFDGSAAILPGKGPVILVDNIGPFTPPSPPDLAYGATDNPGCQGLSWPDDLTDPELTYWCVSYICSSRQGQGGVGASSLTRSVYLQLLYCRISSNYTAARCPRHKDENNPIVIDNLPCGSRVKNTAGAFPGGIFQNGDHWNYLSFGYRFASTDASLHDWHMVEKQFLSNSSARENGGQWTLRVPATPPGTKAPPGTPTHMVSCGDGSRFCLGDYHLKNESWVDAIRPDTGPAVPANGLCTRFGLDWDVPGGDYNQNSSTRVLYKDCAADGKCPCQAACLADSYCDAWTVIVDRRASPARGFSRCCLKHKSSYNPRSIPGSGWVTGVKDPRRCAQGGAGNAAVTSEATGSDSGWWTAGYESGGMGTPDAPAGDRLLNLGWVIKEQHGALTVPRELHWEPETFSLLSNPVAELAALRNGEKIAGALN